MSVSPSILRVEGIALSFGGLEVLQDISLETAPGKLLALIGPNGAGTTSILNCICGIYQPGRGRISLDDELLNGRKPHDIASLGVARTFQHGELFPQMSVVENLLVARHSRIASNVWTEGWFTSRVRAAEREHRRAVEEIIAFVELERYRHRPVGSLPFGLQKVVGFARALAMGPRLLLLDEPSAGLNREEKEDLARFILRIRHELGITMIWVEHDMQMVADLADHLYVVSYGRFLTEGAPAAVLKDSRVVEAYLGRGTP